MKTSFFSLYHPFVPGQLGRLWPLLAAVVTGCGGSDSGPPANVAGSYSMTVTNEASSCNLPGWTAGNVSKDIPVTITQSGSAVTAKVGGLPGGFLNAVLGADTFTGQVSGTAIDLKLRGTKSQTSGTCAYTIDAEFVASSSGDVVEGTVRYSPNTNQSPDCAAVAACSAAQKLNGTRPPT